MSTTSPIASRTGGQILVDALKINHVEHAFCVPGESYLPVLDALYDARAQIQLTVCRQEGGAAYMADAYGKMTGRPGICFVTRGPGATNASVGVHTAFQDSTPMILFIGQVGSDCVEREAFQEIDYRRMFGEMAKWVASIDRADRIPEFVNRAFQVATSGRPGPVVLALPEDVLTDLASVADALPHKPVQASPAADQIESLRAMLASAERPLLVLGGSTWDAAACERVERVAERLQLPVAVSFRRQDLFDNRHPNYAGDVGIGINPKLAERVRGADLLIVAGARLGEMTTGSYTLLDPARPQAQLVHVHPGAEELGRVYQAALQINSGMPQFVAALEALAGIDGSRWAGWTRDANADYRANLLSQPTPAGSFDFGAAMHWLNETLPRDAILCNGAGNYSGWVHRFYQYGRFRTQLAPTNGSMGYGVPAAVAAKIIEPQRTVVAFAGDGCYMMNGQELATAVQYGAAIIIVVLNNGMYGTIRMHQEMRYPERISGTELVNPDFAALAQAYGAHGEVVERTEDFAAAFERARAAGKPALIEVRIDPEIITSRTTITTLRQRARA
ncbi:MAG: thiamine pyrophosphate protein domain protein TPP-binding [Massilia sp.]|nr:thiamine pyrophosphate protein domain protein TPP-binding [Massilia sp.]